MKYHEYADIFPMMAGDDFARLKDDIDKNGLIDPIVILDGMILDGRNRYKACDELGIDFDTVEYSGDDPIGFSISKNMARRHLDSTEKAVAGYKVLPMLEAEAKKRQLATLKQNATVPEFFPEREKGESRDKAAELCNTNPRYISDVKKIHKERPDLYEKMEAGAIALKDVKKIQRKDAQQHKEVKAAAESAPANALITDSQDVIRCDALITDPPYGILSEDWDDIDLESFTRDWLARWNDCAADIFISSWSQRYLFDGRKWFDDELTNYDFQQLLIWHYPNNKSPQSRMGFKHTFEPIFFYRLKGSVKPICVGGGDWGDGLNDFDCHVSAMPQTNFNNQNTKQHPAQKSVDVMRWLVNACSDKGNLIVDPFCGSGTTGVAALQLGRSFHGIEINAEYKEIAKKRVAAYGV